CKRCIAKTPAELMAIAPPETGLQSLTERLKCTDCGTKSFFFRVGSPVLDLTVGNVAKKRRHAE
ncbi:MAG: hypothetical protein CMO04_03195, partial [Thalassospira sp.]|nr:hypothetical protein [Thalassospira sp.]